MWNVSNTTLTLMSTFTCHFWDRFVSDPAPVLRSWHFSVFKFYSFVVSFVSVVSLLFPGVFMPRLLYCPTLMYGSVRVYSVRSQRTNLFHTGGKTPLIVLPVLPCSRVPCTLESHIPAFSLCFSSLVSDCWTAFWLSLCLNLLHSAD